MLTVLDRKTGLHLCKTGEFKEQSVTVIASLQYGLVIALKVLVMLVLCAFFGEAKFLRPWETRFSVLLGRALGTTL